MKFLKTILAIMLSLVVVTAFFGCSEEEAGGNGEGGGTSVSSANGGTSANNGLSAEMNAAISQDKKILSDHGLSTYDLPVTEIYASNMSTTTEELKAILSSSRYDSENPENSLYIYVYYFKDAQSASACFSHWESYDIYKLIGSKIVMGDTNNWITE